MIEPQINELLIKDADNWLHFSNPHRIISVEKLDDVLPALRAIEKHIEQDGWHAAGFLSYEAVPAFDPAHLSKPGSGFPYLWFGLYPKSQLVNLPSPSGPREISDWRPTVDRETYNAAIQKIKEHIGDGRTYQVNYTMRLESDFHGNPWDFFLHLAKSQNNYAAYVDTGRFVICSASPELFFQLDGDRIVCRPMKGTVKRGRTTDEDRAQAQWLKDSEKNRAENVMIVDMIRNDLGRIAKIGSVQVTELFQAERYPTLWQMTSTVTARTNASLTNIFSALFPCASITGAPKVGTMKIINDLETTPRNIYTGTIGYFSPHRKAKFSVAIRTALIDRERCKVEYGIGGGIVWDSTSADEYGEALLKARVLTESQPKFSLFETMLWTPQDGIFLKKEHIARLLDSANYFDFPVSMDNLQHQLEKIERAFTDPQRVKLSLNNLGEIFSESTPYHHIERLLNVHMADEPVDSNDIYLFHKTSHRDAYEKARANFPDHDDVLLYNERGELTEFTIGNLVVELEGELLTPPIDCGVLAGTFRKHLLETDQILEKPILRRQLADCTKVFRINSLRKWERAQLR
jgi:para-aminobenzoate synthetase / 4-amino-4-deoxychorismate lyase